MNIEQILRGENGYKKGDSVFTNGRKWVVEMVMCARIYIRDQHGEMIVPRFHEVKPVLRVSKEQSQ